MHLHCLSYLELALICANVSLKTDRTLGIERFEIEALTALCAKDPYLVIVLRSPQK